MITQDRTKIKRERNSHNFISYFQSVMTVGIVSSAKNIEEAERKSSKKFKNSDMSCGIISQTPFEISDTEPWNPDFSGFIMRTDNQDNIVMDFNDVVKSKIAKKLNKDIDDVTDDDYVDFVKKSVEKNLGENK